MFDEKQIKLVSLVTPYVFAVSLLYLFGYWSSFNINILEYVTFSDVLRLTLYPLVIASLASISGIIFRTVLFDFDGISKGEREKVFVLVSPKKLRVISIITFVGACLVLVIDSDASSWTLAGTLFGVTFILSIDDLEMLSTFIPNPVARRVVIIVAVTVLSTAYGNGKVDADRIFSMNRSQWESYARGYAYPEGWKVWVEPCDSGSGVLGHDSITAMRLTIRPYYDNTIDPPEVLFVTSSYPLGKAPKFTADFKNDLEYEAKRNLGPEYSISTSYTKSSSFEEIELMIKRVRK